MRVVVCDDDPIIRCAVAAVVEHLGGEVLAETDGAHDAVDLIERFSPDVVVLDLGLEHSSGMEIIDHQRHASGGPQLVVFTAFDGVTGIDGRCAAVVHKPDFAELERQLVAAEHKEMGGERRRAVRPVPPPGDSGVDDAHDFYRMLADAEAGDALVTVVPRAEDPLVVAAAVRRCVRSEDRVLLRGAQVLALLIGGGPAGTEALQSRLCADGQVDADVRGVVIDDDPVGSFNSLTAGSSTA